MADSLALAWLLVSRHRLRSLLAMAGVAVGVCALTSIMSVEQSWRKAVADFFAPMDLETVRVAVPAGADWRERGFRKARVDRDDVAAMLAHCSSVESATLMTWGTLRAEADDGAALELAVRAVDADFTTTLPDEVREGRLFTAEEADRQAPVCVLSFEARVWLFGDDRVLGRQVRLEGHAFQVIGVIAGNRHVGIGSRAIYVPSTWARQVVISRYGPEPETEIFARTRDPKLAGSQIEKVMRERVGGRGARPFTRSLWEVKEAALRARTRATLYSGLAGLCALLAAGIGIAALLFVSVAERSREIGIHRALGASRGHVYCEYLLASILLAAGGAVLGALAAIPAASVGAFTTRWQPVLDPLAGEMLIQGARGLPKLSEIALSISWQAAAISVVLALLTGAAAALAPASEAAAVDPVMAMVGRVTPRRGVRKALTCLQVGFGVLVLVVLTSYFSVLESEERAEARELLGQDRVSAIADPIAALRKPVDRRYLEGCRDALAAVVASEERLAAIARKTPLLTALAPNLTLRLTIDHGGRTIDAGNVILSTAAMFEYNPKLPEDVLPRAARAFSRSEAVAVIGSDTRDGLFGNREAVGQRVSIGGKPFTVIAIEPGGSPMFWGNALVPVAFYHDLKHREDPMSWGFMTEPRLDARPKDTRQYSESLVQLRDALLPMLPAEYRKGIKFSEDIPETTKQFIFQHKAVAVRGAVGALAVLLVALIGLANMLLVSVHDEMREIGMRRALGAQRADILLHFLSSGVLLAAAGAALGLGVGALVCGATRKWGGLPISVSVFWAGAGAVATVVAGTIVSVIPALVAARIHPVEALRYE